MGKKRRGGDRVPTAAEGSSETLSTNPFAGLATLKDVAPEGEPVALATGETKRQDDSERPRIELARVVIRRQRKGHGGKTVTVVEGVTGARTAKQDLVRQLQKSLGCGGRLDGDAIVLTGVQHERLGAWFASQGAKVVLGTD